MALSPSRHPMLAQPASEPWPPSVGSAAINGDGFIIIIRRIGTGPGHAFG
jgi:hypothetical protein